MKKILILLLLCHVLYMAGGILKLISFEQDVTDMRGMLYPVEKEDHDHCALLRIEHNHSGEVFLEGVKVYKKLIESPSCTYFYISHTEKSIIINAEPIEEDYKSIKYHFPQSLKRNDVYVLKLAVFTDSEDKKKLVQINTIPQEAEVWLNDEKLDGRTPFNFYHDVGNYKIRITREDYLEFTGTVNIKSKDNVFEYQLKPVYGTLNIFINEHATVYLNGKLITQLKNIHLDPGEFSVHVEQRLHFDRDITSTIETGDDYPLPIELDPICGLISIKPEPADAELIFTDELGKQTSFTGEITKQEMMIGNYTLEANKEGYYFKDEEFYLGEGESLTLLPKLKSAKVFFSLDIPSAFKEKLTVHVYRMKKNRRGSMYHFERNGNKYIVGEYATYLLTICHNEQEIFEKKIEVSENQLPHLSINCRQYNNPTEKCRLYVDGDYRETGCETILVTEDHETTAKVKLPRYLDMKQKVSFPEKDSIYTLKLGRDYFKRGFGLGLIPDKTRKFLGIKLPIIYSSEYYKMTGIEFNVFRAGNYAYLEGSGTFTGIAAGGLCAIGGRDLNGIALGGGFVKSERDLNGLSIGGICNLAGRDINGITLGGLFVKADHDINGLSLAVGVTASKNNTNGFAIGGLVVGADNKFSGIGISGFLKSSKDCSGFVFSPINITKGSMSGVQVGLINSAKELHGIQIGLFNVVSDGEGGAVPFLPIVNIYF